MSIYGQRLTRLQAEIGKQGVDAIFISPGPDLRYFTGYDAVPLERLTALVVQVDRDPFVISPFLEKSAALASPIGELGLNVVTWQETENPYQITKQHLNQIDTFAVDGRMWAEKLLNFQDAFQKTKCISGTSLISTLRMKKDASEIESLIQAGSAIDHVHAQVPNFLKVGRTEREIGADIADAILKAGHKTVDFVIVGSGPNSASPHHEVSDRVLQDRDVVVVDLGGTMPDGYCSDSTRTYAVGSVADEYQQRYEVLQAAQQMATEAVRPGVTCESIDQIARNYMTEKGIGDLFIHRIGHGIGLETHEHPYMVEGNTTILEEGFAFSIEPGFYESGKSGARIEDIVVCGSTGAIVLNNQPRNLQIV